METAITEVTQPHQQKVCNMDKIKTKHWQKKLNSIGEIVTDIADIEQCYDTIFSTVKGSCPLLLNLGSDIINAIGQNPQKAEKIIKTILLKELPLQEPRAEVLDIRTKFNVDGKITVQVHFKCKLTNEERIKTYYV